MNEQTEKLISEYAAAVAKVSTAAARLDEANQTALIAAGEHAAAKRERELARGRLDEHVASDQPL